MKQKRENKYRKICENAGLNYKNELMKVLIVNFVLLGGAIALYFLTKQVIALVGIVLFLLALNYLLLTRPGQIIKKQKENLEAEFVHVFVYFGLFIKNGRPVYNALEDCLRYCSDSLAEKMRNMLEEIDLDKSIAPYMNFAKNFENLEIKQVLISIYKMSIEGSGEEYISQFDSLFTALSKAKREKAIETEKGKYENFNFMPMLASALSMGIIAVAVILLMEEYSNVV